MPGSGRSPGGGLGNLLQYSYLTILMDRGAWQAAVHGVTKSRTRLSYCAQPSAGNSVCTLLRAAVGAAPVFVPTNPRGLFLHLLPTSPGLYFSFFSFYGGCPWRISV